MNRIEDVYGLTPVQEGMYTQTFLQKETKYYLLNYLFSVKADTDLFFLQQALDLLPLRHPVMKTAFAVVEGVVKQVILANRLPDVRKRIFNVPYTSDVLSSAVREETAKPFDLQRDPLVCCVFFLFQDRRFLFFHTHHLIFDGWCMAVLYEDFISYYNALANGESVSSLTKRIDAERAAEPSFSSYVNLIRSREPEQAWQHWRTLLDGYTSVFLPGIQVSAPGDWQVLRITEKISSVLTEAVAAFAKENEIPLNTVFESAFGLTLQKHTGSLDTVFFKVLSGRSFGFVNSERTLGPMINTVPVRSLCTVGQTLRSFMRQMNEQSVTANEFGFLPLAEVCLRSSVDPRTVQALFDYGNYIMPDMGASQPLSLLEQNEQTEFPLTFMLSPFQNGFLITVSYKSVCFSEGTVRSLLNSYRYILKSLTAIRGSQLDDPDVLRHLRGLTPDERRLIFGDGDKGSEGSFCAGGQMFIPEKSVYALFEEQARRVPQEAAIFEGEVSYSLKQLEKDAVRIDAFLRHTLVEGKHVVGILCDRSYAELAAVFGVIRGGNAYMPISPQTPPERIRGMIETSGCELVLAQEKYISLSDHTCCLEQILNQPIPDEIPAVCAEPEDTLYVICTSGSTGTPKGAMVSNRSAINRIEWMSKRWFGPSTVVMLKTPYTFDVSVWEILGFALYGFSLYILPPEAHYDQCAVLSHIEKGKVTDIHFVPSVFDQFLTVLGQTPDAAEKLRSVRNVFLSGERLSAKLVNTFRRYHCGRISVHNLYGPAECSIDVTSFDCAESETDPVPIGRPISNTRIYILNNDMEPVPVGVTGELCIAGENVGQGYLNNPRLTEDKFVKDPFYKGKMYRTGDLAFWREDGNVVFAGRNDLQIKIHGQRVELGEIEAAIAALEGVESAAVILHKENEDSEILCAFYSGKPYPAGELRALLSKTLPRYMIPQAFTHLKTIPLNQSGKTDRALLADIPLPDREVCNSCLLQPQTETEKAVCSAFCKALGLKEIDRNADFYELGGTSFMLVGLLSQPPLEGLSPSDFLADPTPAGLAKRLESLKAPDNTHVVPLYVPPDAKKTVVLFPFAGGNAAAYTVLSAEARRKKCEFALYFVDWPEPDALPLIAQELRILASKTNMYFYSHCAGSVIALSLLDIINAETTVIRGYAVGANIPPRGVSGVNIWAHMTDGAILKLLRRAGLQTAMESESSLRGGLDRFRSQTSSFYQYFKRKKTKTNVTVEVVVSRNDLFTPNYADAETNWKRFVVDVSRVIIIDTPSHYFQNADAGLLLGLFNEWN